MIQWNCSSTYQHGNKKTQSSWGQHLPILSKIIEWIRKDKRFKLKDDKDKKSRR